MAGGKERKNGEVMKKKQRPIKASVKMRGRFFAFQELQLLCLAVSFLLWQLASKQDETLQFACTFKRINTSESGTFQGVAQLLVQQSQN